MNTASIVGMVVLAFLGLLVGWWLGKTAGIGGLSSTLAGKEAELTAKSADFARVEFEVQQRDAMLASLREEQGRLIAEHAASKQNAEGLAELTKKQETTLFTLRDERSALESGKTRSEEQLKAAQQSLADLTRIKSEMENAFKALAADALRGANEQFLGLANSQFDAKQLAIDTLLQPVKLTLDKLNDQTQQLEVKREGAYEKLGQQLLQLSGDQASLQQAAQALSSALRDTRTTGKWGEIVLHRVVELAGMTEHCDFTQQHTQDDNRPDLVVHLPNGRTIIVDAKTTMSHFHDAADIVDETLRLQKLKDHARNIRAQAMGLAKRRYEKAFEDAIDLTICFVPGDVYYYAALQVDQALFEDAANEKILFATPTTLIALLKAAAFGWQQDSLRREAREILKQAQVVYERLTTAAVHFKNLRGSLNSSVENYDKLLASLETRVFPAGRRMKELGISGDDLPSMEPIDRTIRLSQAPDWRAADENGTLALAAAEERREE